MQCVRQQGQWVAVRPRPFEPERKTADLVWLRLKGDPQPDRSWCETERKVARLLANVSKE